MENYLRHLPNPQELIFLKEYTEFLCEWVLTLVPQPEVAKSTATNRYFRSSTRLTRLEIIKLKLQFRQLRDVLIKLFNSAIFPRENLTKNPFLPFLPRNFKYPLGTKLLQRIISFSRVLCQRENQLLGLPQLQPGQIFYLKGNLVKAIEKELKIDLTHIHYGFIPTIDGGIVFKQLSEYILSADSSSAENSSDSSQSDDS